MQRETRTAHHAAAALSAVALVLLSLPLSSPVRSLKAAVGYALDPLAYQGDQAWRRLAGAPPRVRQLIEAESRNRELSAQLRRDEWLKTEMLALGRENERLRQALELSPSPSRAPLWVRVMERDPERWHRTLVVDAGAERGISAGDPVLGPKDGRLVAVGRVAEVRPNSSTVLLLTDARSAAAAYLSSGTVEGLVQGQDGPVLRMDYLPAPSHPLVGDKVLTSPTSAAFPPDVEIGKVLRSVPADPFLGFRSVELTPAADASSLQTLVVLRSHPRENADDAETVQ